MKQMFVKKKNSTVKEDRIEYIYFLV